MDASHSLPPHSSAMPGASGDVCLANARLVLPDRVLHGAVTVEGGTITAIEEGDRVRNGATDCAGRLVMPGLVELHTDNLERHIEPRPSVAWPHGPALLAHDAELASTGITTVFDALRVGSIIESKAGYLPYARGLADELLSLREQGGFKISHFLHLRAEICSETLPEELAAFGPADRVGIVSLMDHTPGQRQFRDISKLKDYVAKKRGMSDEEFEDHVAALRDLQARLGAGHEREAVAAAARLGAALCSHDDTTAAQVAASEAHDVDFAEFPTTSEAADACHAASIPVMMGAPNLIRGGSHSGNVAAIELARAGRLDILSSDYVPAALLLSALRLAEVWQDLPRAIATVTSTPARVTGLADRGTIAVGLRGDLIEVDRIAGTPSVQSVRVRGTRVA